MRGKIAVLALAACLMLPACAGWKVNGVDTTGLNSGNQYSTFCKENPGVCVAGAIATGAFLSWIISNQQGSNRRGGGSVT